MLDSLELETFGCLLLFIILSYTNASPSSRVPKYDDVMMLKDIWLNAKITFNLEPHSIRKLKI